jgi:hypothetical protein
MSKVCCTQQQGLPQIGSAAMGKRTHTRRITASLLAAAASPHTQADRASWVATPLLARLHKTHTSYAARLRPTAQADASYAAGSRLRICSFWLLLRPRGKATSQRMTRLPRRPGCRLMGMPSPLVCVVA